MAHQQLIGGKHDGDILTAAKLPDQLRVPRKPGIGQLRGFLIYRKGDNRRYLPPERRLSCGHDVFAGCGTRLPVHHSYPDRARLQHAGIQDTKTSCLILLRAHYLAKRDIVRQLTVVKVKRSEIAIADKWISELLFADCLQQDFGTHAAGVSKSDS